MWRFYASLIFCLLSSAACADDLAQGLAAYRAQDYAQALLLLAPLAEQGEPSAQYTLGQMYRRGRGFVKSMAEALPLLQQAAAAHYPPALIALGEMYETGEGEAHDLAAAEQFYKEAAESGNAQAQLRLGVHFIRIETGRDFAQAAAWLTLAAQQNEPEAQYFLARLLLDGRGVEADRAGAMLWFYRAGAQGHAPSQRFLYLLKQAETPERELALRDLRRQLTAGVAQLEAVASDPGYGFDKMHPVNTGAGFPAEWRYLNALRGPGGEVVHYQRIGACCAFDTPAAEQGKGFLDHYRLHYAGLETPLDIYLNMFAPPASPDPSQEPPPAPFGLTFVRAAAQE